MLQDNNKKFPAVSTLLASLALAAALSACNDAQAPSASLYAEAVKYRSAGKFSAATLVLKNLTEQAPNDAQARALLANVYLDTGDALSADKEIRRALGLGHAKATALPVLARALLLQGQFQKLLDETAQQALQMEPTLLCLRADALLALGKLDAARAIYNSVLDGHREFVPALIGLGRMSYVEAKVDQAEQYSARALAAAPDDTEALLFKGDLLRAQNKGEDALKAYDRVLALHPSHRSAYVEKAYLETALGKFDAAQADITKAKELTPASVLVAYTQALLDYSKGDDNAALESIQKVLRVASEHMPSVLLAGAISQRSGSLYQAEHHLRHYLEKNPDNLLARKMLASVLLRTRHAPDALSVLEPAMTDKQQDVQLLALAGESFMQARDFGRAADYFGRASKLDPKAAGLRTSLALSKLGKGQNEAAISDLQAATKLDVNSLQAGVALVRAELDLKRVDNAFAAVLALEHAQPTSPAAADLKGIVYIAKGEPVLARASFARALVLDPAYFSAAENLVRLDLTEGKRADAYAQLLHFLSKNKNSVEAMSALASLAVADKKDEDATRWLAQAVALNPAAINTSANLIAQYLRTGQNEKALNLARKLRVAHPENPDLLDLLGKAQLASGEQNNALSTYKTLASTLPRSAEVQMQVAALELLAKNKLAAEDYLKSALAIQPDFPAAQLALAELYVSKGHFALALMTAGQLQDKHPAASAGYQLEGDILVMQGKASAALPWFEKAFTYTRKNELLIKIAGSLRAAGKPDDAARRLNAWIAEYPQDLRVQLFKAQTLVADKQYKQAAEQLEAILKRSPKNIIALNNLAMAYLLGGDARAEAVAERALALAPDAAVVMDTLGWIQLEKGDAERGLQMLQRASAQAPEARDIRYHMAVGLLRTGKKVAALKELQTVVAGNASFEQAGEARALLKQLE
jgi:putative PEP-CTERM system TPR-repeat lipoprotein